MGQVVSVGRLYRAGPRETVEGVGLRLGMPPARLLDLNRCRAGGF